MEIVKSRFGVDRSIERINLSVNQQTKMVTLICLILREVLVIHWEVNSNLRKCSGESTTLSHVKVATKTSMR
jgi:hypothetical protein